MSNTKNNHYVPKFYLKNFFDSNKCIWKLDKKNNEIYSVNNLNSECSKKNLYTVKQKISPEDIKIALMVFKMENREMYVKTINYLSIFLNDEIGNLFLIKYPKNKEIEFALNNSINKYLNNSDLSRTQEILFTEFYEKRFIETYNKIIETSSIDFLRQKIEENISVYTCANITNFVYSYLNHKLNKIAQQKELSEFKPIKLEQHQYYDFILYFLMQSLRTERFLNEIQGTPQKSKLDKHVNINNRNFAFLCMNIMLIILVKCLFYPKSPFRFILIKNKSNTDFITSDCPCSNIYASFRTEKLLLEHEIEFLYPLSPKLALLMTYRECYISNNIVVNKDKDIDIYNKTILKNANRFIYANSEDLLKKYQSI